MKREQIKIRLTDWAKRIKALDAQYDAHADMTGAQCDSPLWNPVFEMQAAYTVAVGELVGDNNEWLQWYKCETNMGKKELIVKSDTGVTIKVKTLKHLARVISWG